MNNLLNQLRVPSRFEQADTGIDFSENSIRYAKEQANNGGYR